jgi:hypothetical protein
MPQSFADELSSIPTSPNLGQSLERAHRFAREQSHKAVTLEHLLLALTEDAEAALILQSANVDLARLGTDVSGYLGRLFEDMRADGSVEPRPDAHLLRVLQAAASAAKQSRRKQIDGAIVLAAIVGDSKSPAAGLLKSLGMTFEEAIRALQRANAKARLQPAAKKAGAAPSARPGAAPEAASVQREPPAELPDAATATPEPSTPAGSAPQSAEDILAAARARIQQRAGGGPASRTASLTTPVEAEDEKAAPPQEPAETMSLTQAIEAAMSPSPARPAEPPAPAAQPPAPPVAAQPAPPAWTPPPEPRLQTAPRVQPARGQPPFPARPIAPGEGPRRPPLPAQGGRQAQAGFPNRPARAPWPELGDASAGTRPALPNGATTPGPPPERPAAYAAPQATQAQRGAAHGDKTLLVESVPRRMRVGKPAGAEVRIARDRVDALVTALNGRASASPADRPLMRALSIRLRAPQGDFWIEPTAPETQWVETATGIIHDDYAAWRWTVVPQRRGRGRLTLIVSARSIGRDGVTADLAPPDRSIDVKVGANYGSAIARWLGLLAAMAVGALLGHFSQQAWTVITLVARKALGA